MYTKEITMSKLPVLFVGHGSPMNAIETNAFTEGWEALGLKIGKPSAILAVSAHWYTRGLFVSTAAQNRQVYDMYGFPQELYDVKYAPKGDPALARRVLSLLPADAKANQDWGIDHGVWSVLCRMVPDASIPVVMMSIDGFRSAEEQYALGEALKPLREENVLILGSGNVVHHLGLIDWDNPNGGYPWADAFDHYVRDAILAGDFQKAIRYKESGLPYQKAFPTPDHFNPLPVILGAASADDKVSVWNDARTLGSLSMTSYLFE